MLHLEDIAAITRNPAFWHDNLKNRARHLEQLGLLRHAFRLWEFLSFCYCRGCPGTLRYGGVKIINGGVRGGGGCDGGGLVLLVRQILSEQTRRPPELDLYNLELDMPVTLIANAFCWFRPVGLPVYWRLQCLLLDPVGSVVIHLLDQFLGSRRQLVVSVMLAGTG